MLQKNRSGPAQDCGGWSRVGWPRFLPRNESGDVAGNAPTRQNRRSGEGSKE